MRLYQTRLESPESRAFEFTRVDILAVSSRGELALQLDPVGPIGRLARAPISGGVPRDILEEIPYAGADWSPDGKELAVARENRLEYPIGTVLHRGSERVRSPRFSPSGREIAFLEGSELSVIDVATRKSRRLSGGWDDLTGVPNWPPGGKEVWFTAARTGEMHALRAVTLTGRERLVARVPGILELDDIAPDGRVLVAHHTLRPALVARAAGESAERELPSLDWPEPASLSSDGRSVLFTEFGEGGGSGNSVYLGRTDGSSPVRLGEGEALALSQDGKVAAAIQYPVGRNAPPKLVLLPAGAGQMRLVATEGLEDIERADFLPDGRRIAVSGRWPGARRCCLARRSGDPRGDRVRLHTFSRRWRSAPPGRPKRRCGADGRLGRRRKRLLRLQDE
jgi:Tol biopolymer transport system component